jgi:hypothetical protein
MSTTPTTRLSDGAKHMRRLITRRLPVAAALGALVFATACVEHEAVLPPVTPQSGGDLFANYVALGNSITAGWQSGGINDSTQMESYAVMLAEQAGAEFGVPLLEFPGCPPPFVTPFGPQRIGGLPADFCALRTTPAGHRLNNLAVPDARIATLFDATVAANALTTLVLGGRTQIEAMQAADPSLVSVWIGNNDALRAAIGGLPALLTPLNDFQSEAQAIGAAIAETNALDAILIGVVDAIAAAPVLQPGAYFWALYQANPNAFGGKSVNDNCAPIDYATGQPNPLGAHMVSFRIVPDANFPEINCSGEAYPEGDPRRGVHVLTLEDQQIIRTRVAQYNAVLEGIADANDWIYVDPARVFLSALMDGPPFNKIRKCQALQMLPPDATMEQFQQAVLQSCPVPPEMGGAPNFVGSWISFDGLHPARPAHEALTNAIIAELNARHGLSIPTR